jgi:hypothetical protein
MGGKNLEIVDTITEKVIKTSLEFEQKKFKESENKWPAYQKLNS